MKLNYPQQLTQLLAKANQKIKFKPRDLPNNLLYSFFYLDLDSNQWGTFVNDPTTSSSISVTTLNNTVLTNFDNGQGKFAVLVTNTDTLENEMTMVPVSLNVIYPTVDACHVTANATSITPNMSVTLTASATPSFSVEGTNMAYKWQYKTVSGDWTDLNPQTGVNITNNTSSKTSQLEISNFPLKDSGTQFRCLASYGDYVTNVQSDPVTITVSQGTIAPTDDQIQALWNDLHTKFSAANIESTLTNVLGMSKNGSPSANWSQSALSGFYNELGITNPLEQQAAFGSKPPVKITPVINGMANMGDASGSGESTNSSDLILIIEFDLQPGYTWDLSHLSAGNQGSTYHIYENKLAMKVQTDLPPPFGLTPTTDANLTLSSSSNSISIGVKPTKTISTVNWYAVKPTYSQWIKYTGFKLSQDSAQFKELFGADAQISISNDTGSGQYTLNITGIDTSNSDLDGYYLVPEGIISSDGQFWQEIYGQQQFQITVDNAPTPQPSPVPPAPPVLPPTSQTGPAGDGRPDVGSGLPNDNPYAPKG